MNINKVFLMGRLTSDPELRVSQSGISVANFTIAVGRRIKRDETDFIDCVAFRQTADVVCKYFKRGSLIIAFGSLQVDNWKDKDGKSRKTVRVVVDDVQFGESKKVPKAFPPRKIQTEKKTLLRFQTQAAAIFLTMLKILKLMRSCHFDLKGNVTDYGKTGKS